MIFFYLKAEPPTSKSQVVDLLEGGGWTIYLVGFKLPPNKHYISEGNVMLALTSVNAMLKKFINYPIQNIFSSDFIYYRHIFHVLFF